MNKTLFTLSVTSGSTQLEYSDDCVISGGRVINDDCIISDDRVISACCVISGCMNGVHFYVCCCPALTDLLEHNVGVATFR